MQTSSPAKARSCVSRANIVVPRVPELEDVECHCAQCARWCIGLPGRARPCEVLAMLEQVGGDMAQLVPRLSIEVENGARTIRPRTIWEPASAGLAPVFPRAGPCVFLNPHTGCTLLRPAMPVECKTIRVCQPVADARAGYRIGEMFRRQNEAEWNSSEGRVLMGAFASATQRANPLAEVETAQFEQRLLRKFGDPQHSPYALDPLGEFVFHVHQLVIHASDGTGDIALESASIIERLEIFLIQAKKYKRVSYLLQTLGELWPDLEWALNALNALGHTTFSFVCQGVVQRVLGARIGPPLPLPPMLQ